MGTDKGRELKSIEKIVQTISYIILFLLEIWVILLLFTDLTNDPGARVFWFSMAFVVTVFHLFVIIRLKSYIKAKSALAIPYLIVYLLALAGLSTASLSYNLKALNGRAEIDRYAMEKTGQAETTIRNNEVAIGKYQDIISGTNDIQVIFRYRRMIEGLEARDVTLTESLPKTQNSIKIDSFGMIAKTLNIPRDNFLFMFLCWVWLLAEIGLLLTTPTLKTESASLSPTIKKEWRKFNALKNFDFEKYLKPTVKDFVANNRQAFIDYVDISYRTDRTILDDNSVKRTMKTNQTFINNCRTALLKIAKDETPMITNGRFNFSKTETIEIIKSL